MDYKGKLNLVLLLSGKGRYLTSKFQCLDESKSLKHSHLFASVD